MAKKTPRTEDILPFYEQKDGVNPSYLTDVWSTGTELISERLVAVPDEDFDESETEIKPAKLIKSEKKKKQAEKETKKETVPHVTVVEVKPKSSVFPARGDSFGEVLRKLVFIASLSVFAVAAVVLASTLLQSQAAIEDKNANISIANTTVATSINEEGEIVTVAPTIEEQEQHNSDLNEHFLAITDDYIGYIWADGCEISDPVVRGDDNEYYLKNNYYGEPNKAGAVFMDYRVKIEEDYQSPNVVIYGHNQEDGTMFGNLKRYKNDIPFYSENAFIQFNTLYDIGEYVVYGFFVTNALETQDSEGEVFRYHDYIESLSNENTFYWYLDEVYKRNQIISPVDVKFGDKLLTLSTCSNEFTNSRFVVFARKLRPDETKDSFDFSLTEHNYNMQGLDWDAIISSGVNGLSEATTVVTYPNQIYSNAEEVAIIATRPTVAETAATETAATETVATETAAAESIAAETTAAEETTAAITTVPETESLE
jgi:sortase B